MAAQNCNVKLFFNMGNVDHMQSLIGIIGDAYWDVVDSAEIARKKFSTGDFYNRLLTLLKSLSTPFKVEYSTDLTESQIKIFKLSFEALKQVLLDGSIIPNDFKKNVKMSELMKMIDERFLSDLGASRLRFNGESEESSFEINLEGASNNDTPSKEVRFNQFIQNTYGNCFGAVKQLRNLFSREIFTHTICNFENGFLVTTNTELNENIALYKNMLLQRIVRFLSTINPNTSYVSEVYTVDGFIHRGYFTILNDMRAYLENIDSELVINDEYARALFGSESPELTAIHAYSMLRYFDSLLLDTIGRTIKYNSKYRNTEVNFNLGKYEFSKDTLHQRKSWNDSENRTAVQNSSKFSKFVLDSIPLKINGLDSGKNIGMNLFSSTITKLFSNVSYLAENDITLGVQLLVEYILAFHGSPPIYAYKIFNLINSSKEIQGALKNKKVGFTDEDLGVIQSLYEYVFSYDTEMHLKRDYNLYNTKSIRTIEFNKLRTSYNLGKYSILSDIVGVIDDCMDATYFYTEYGTEGGINIQKRVKYKNRRDSEKFKDTINAANITYSQEFRQLLREECLVDFTTKTSTQHAKVTIPIKINGLSQLLKFKIDASSIALGLLGAGNIKVLADEEARDLFERAMALFDSNSPIDLSLAGIRSKLLSKEAVLTEDEQLFKEVLRFIDDRLPTKFLTYDGLLKLNIYLNLKWDEDATINPLNDLLLYATKSLVVSDIYYDFTAARLDPSNSAINSLKDLLKFLRRRYTAFSNISAEDKKIYFITNNGVSRLRTIPSSTQWVDTYALASLILFGENVASVSKNLSGNNDANYVTAFLGGQIFNVCYKARLELNRRSRLINQGENIPQSAASALLFTKHAGAIKQCVINSDIKNRKGAVKSIRDLKASELFYNAIVHNFWSSYLSTGEYCILPTTYSDKVKLIQYLIDGLNYRHFGKKNLHSLTTDEIIELYRSTIGEASRLAVENIVYFYQQLWGETLTLNLINSRLKGYTLDRLVREAQAKGLEVMADFHYRMKNIDGKEALSVNEVLLHQAQYSDLQKLKNKFAIEEVNFINDLVNSGVSFYIDYHDTSLYSSTYRDLSLRELLKNSASPIANIILSQYTTNDELEAFANKWIKNGKLILAYDQDRKAVLHTNVKGVTEINPLLEKYFYLDTLLANNLRLQLTGFETNHPDKSKFSKMWDNVAGGLGVKNLLLASTKNIERLLKAKIIWGHPALGKTTYDLADPNRIIEWDKEFNPIRNQFIALTLGNSSEEAKQNFLREAYNYVRGIGEYSADLEPAYEVYKQMIETSWETVKQKAVKEGKKIFASPTILLEMFGKDFDLVLTMDEKTFLQRKPQGLAWKQAIDALLANPTLVSKTINVGNLFMSDIMALNDSYDLHLLSQSKNLEAKQIANNLITIVENISQGTQLKRNVIIPATTHYMHNDFLEGVSKRIKVAIIHDIPAKVFNFSGLSDMIDSMDGSAFTTAFLSILENMSLGSQEVGDDKKPIWHHYDQSSGTAGLMKFASFVINNERMLLSMNSNVPLIRMFKKMTNLLWSNLDANGIPVSWNTSHPITLGMSVKFTGANRIQQRLNFLTDILGKGKALYYSTYDKNGEVVYKQITGFGGDAINGYYTIESYVDLYGDADLLRPRGEQVYHYFGQNSEYHTTKLPGDHTINSLYELWLALGGVHSQELGKDGKMQPSESSHYAVVGFMNSTIFAKEGAGVDRFDLSQNSYDQPLKEMMIGYLTNNSGMKNGASNRNSVQRWYDGDETYGEWLAKNNLVDSSNVRIKYQKYILDSQLAYMEMDSDGLGVLMDADHDIEEAATMTEFSQVIAALESGGYLHKYSKQVYQDLGKVAAIASKVEIDAVVKFLSGVENDYDLVKSDLYDILGRTLLNGIKTREDLANLTDDILKAISKRFNLNLNHVQDIFKVPFSDPNIYSLILPTFISIINLKSIKRKYPGSGCVMIPGYNVIQYFKIGDRKYTFSDLVRMAIQDAKTTGRALPLVEDRVNFEKVAVREYLEILQNDPNLLLERNSVNDFIPTDIVDIKIGDTWSSPINLDDLDTYYCFKELSRVLNILRTGIASDEEAALVNSVLDTLRLTADLVTRITGVRYDIRLPRNLSPVRITFEVAEGPSTGRKMNVFDLKPFRDAYLSSKTKNEALKAANQAAVQEAFRLLDEGFIIDETGTKVRITNLQNMPAEMVISNMYSTKFGTKNKSVAQILDEGVDAFKIDSKTLINSKHYDIIFNGASDNNVYISFLSPKGNSENSYYAYKESNLLTEKDSRGNINVFLTSDENRKLFRVGRYVIKEGYSYRDSFVNNEGVSVAAYEALNAGYTHSLGKFFDESGNLVLESEAMKKGYTYHQPNFYDSKGRLVPSKLAENLRVNGSTVYEYIEFVSRYRVTERFNEDDNIYHIQEYDKYYINVYNIKRAFPQGSDDDTLYNINLKNFVTGILDDIYATLQFLGITVNPELTTSAAGNIVRFVTNMKNISSDFRKMVLKPLEDELRARLKPLSDLEKQMASLSKTDPDKAVLAEKYLTLELTPISITESLRLKYEDFYTKLALDRFSSWKQSLYFTAARIPAQTLQSFMQMEAIAYSGNSLNKVYVSHWQAWLQGSDYKRI